MKNPGEFGVINIRGIEGSVVRAAVRANDLQSRKVPVTFDTNIPKMRRNCGIN